MNPLPIVARVDMHHVRELADFLRRLPEERDIILGPTDRALLPIALENLEKLMRGGLISSVIEV